MTQRVFDEYKGFLYSIAAKNNVSYDVAVDAYTEAVAQLIAKIGSGKFIPKFPKSCSTFIHKVCHNKCVDYIRKESRQPYLEYINDSEDPNKYEPLTEDERIKLADVLDIYGEKIGKTCRDILELHIKGYKPEEISTRLGLKNANSVSATKSKCIKDLTKVLKEGNNLS